MAKPIIIAETPNAGASGRGLLASREGVSEREAAAFVACVRQAEAVGANYLAVRKMVMQRSSGREAPCVLVLAGIDVASLDEGRRAELLKKLKGFLPEVEYAAEQVQWAGETRRVVPSYELSGLIDAEIAGLPAADAAGPRGGSTAPAAGGEASGGSGGLWIALAAMGLVLIVGVVAVAIVLNQSDPEKKDNGEKDGGKAREKPKDVPLTPAEKVAALHKRAEQATSHDRLDEIEQEVARYRADPAFEGQEKALDAIAPVIAGQREALAKADAAAKEAERKAQIDRDARAWPGTEAKVVELYREDRHLEAARALGQPNLAFPKEWEQLRDRLAFEVRAYLSKRARDLMREGKLDDAREAVREMTRPELAALGPEILKAAREAIAAIDPLEDRFRYDEARDATEEKREKHLRDYLNSPVRRKRGQREAALLLRWMQGAWPRSVPLEVALDPDAKAKEGTEFTLSLAADKGEPVVRTVRFGKGGMIEPARVTFTGRPGLELTIRAGKEVGTTFPLGRFHFEHSVTAGGLRLGVAGLKPLPNYDVLPPVPTGD